MDKAYLELADHLNLAPALIKRCLMLNRQKQAYREWPIPKPAGGIRLISHPEGEMLRLHYALYRFLYPYADPYFYRKDYPKIAYGCLTGPGRAVRDCLATHQSGNFLVTCDIKNAFNSVRFLYLRKRLGETLFWNELKEAAKLDLLAELLVVRQSPRFRSYLPQGSPASPTVFNLVMRQIDWLLYHWATSQNLVITRYVDCYGISGSKIYPTPAVLEPIAAYIAEMITKLSDGDLKINPEKTTLQVPNTGSCSFEWLGGLIEGSIIGPRSIRINDEKLKEYCQMIDEAIANQDFSDQTQLAIRGIQAWAASLSRGKIPSALAERLGEYKRQARSPDQSIIYLHPNIYPYIDGQGVLFVPIESIETVEKRI